MFLHFSLKLECEKLASEKTEMQRHYVMVSTIIVARIILDLVQAVIESVVSKVAANDRLGNHFPSFLVLAARLCVCVHV